LYCLREVIRVQNFVENLKGRLDVSGKDNIKMDLKSALCESVPQDTVKYRVFCKHGDETSGSKQAVNISSA